MKKTMALFWTLLALGALALGYAGCGKNSTTSTAGSGGTNFMPTLSI